MQRFQALASRPAASIIDLPAPVVRYRAVAAKDGPRTIETVAIETSGWMRRPGLPRIPLEIRMAHKLGHEFVHDIRIGRGRLSFRFGLDAYIGGHGLMKIGPTMQTGVAFDQGALVALWGEALGFPAAWATRTDIRWEPVDAHTARLMVVGPEGEIPITVRFDPDTGCPVSCTADRYKAAGPKVGWTGRYSDWRRFDAGVLAPGQFEVQWADEPYPWLTIRTISISVNVDVEDALHLGRDAFDAAERGRPRRARPVPDERAGTT